MKNQQGAPEALRLADALCKRVAESSTLSRFDGDLAYAAAELRHLHAENERPAALLEAQQPAPSAAAVVGTNTKTAELLSTTVGLLIGYREGGARQPYKPGSVVAKVIDEVVDHLKDWPYPEPAPTPQADSAQDEPLQAFDSPRAKALMRAWEEGWAACRDAEYVGEEAQNDAFNSSHTLTLCIAEDQQLPAPQTDSQPAPGRDALDAAFEAVRKRLCAMQRYSFVLDDDGVVRRVHDRTGNWIEFDEAHALLDPVAVDAAVNADRADRAPADSVTAPADVKVVTDGMVLAALQVQYPEAYSQYLRHPANGPKTALRTESEIDTARRMIVAALSAAPTLPAQAADSVTEDAARLDWLDQQCEAYGFQDIHEGNRWEISGPYANVRVAIDAERAARKQGGA